MEKIIIDFPKQFEYKPEIENADKLGTYSGFVVAGVGGSGLAADILKAADPSLNCIIRKDYGLPEDIDGRLVIVNSYSGNTEEAIDALNEAEGRGLDVAIISTNGKLMRWATENSAPFIKIPDAAIQPRFALGYDTMALAKLMNLDSTMADLSELSDKLKPDELKTEGLNISEKLKNKIPVIYASRANWSVAYNWKIIFNETGKIPAFYNVFPELNHNEMTGFDVKDSSRHLSDKFLFMVIRDEDDDSRIIKRMDALTKMYSGRSLPVIEHSLKGDGRLGRIFSSIITANWAALQTAKNYNLDPEKVPMVEEFKKMIQ